MTNKNQLLLNFLNQTERVEINNSTIINSDNFRFMLMKSTSDGNKTRIKRSKLHGTNLVSKYESFILIHASSAKKCE
jgi:hypothetical protein